MSAYGQVEVDPEGIGGLLDVPAFVRCARHEAPRTKMTDDWFTDPQTVEALSGVLDRLVAATGGASAERRAALGDVVGRLAIDIERFGDVT